jgi:hypothetical protein
MKRITIVLGDIHGRETWKSILFQNPDFSTAVFIGDYFDTHEDIPASVQMYNFQAIINYKKENPDKEIMLLIGNHDHHYFPEVGYSGTSGYQSGAAKSIEFLINENRDLLQTSFAKENLLFSHAGVGEVWMERIVEKLGERLGMSMPELTALEISKFVNDTWRHNPLLFNFTGREDSGDDIGQTPIWIRPRSLMKDSQLIKEAGVIQVVGHTTQRRIDSGGKSTGGKYWFVDTLGTSGEYLRIEDGEISTKKI